MAVQGWSVHMRALLVLALPLMGSNLAQFLIQLTDSVMLGWYDVEALAAVTLAGGVHFLVFILGAGIGFVVSPLVAAAEARNDLTEARRVTRMALWLSTGYALLVGPVYIFAEPLMRALGQTPEMAGLAAQYLRIIWFSLAPALAVVVLKSYLSAVELTGVILRATIGAALANVALNRVLIFGLFGLPGMGVRGAALASVLTVIVSLIWLVLFIRARLPEQQLFRRLWVGDLWAARRVLAMGVPVGLTTLAEGGLFAISSVMVGWIGTIELASHGIALQIASLFFMTQLGLSQAVTVRIGRFHGQNNLPELHRAALTALILSGAFVVLSVVALLLFPRLMVSVFVNPADPAREAIQSLGVQLLAMAALFQLVDAAQVMMLSMLRGVQDTKVPMMLAVLCYWGLGLSTSLLFGFGLGLGAVGVWLGLCVGLGAAAITMSWRFWHRSLRARPKAPRL